MIETTNNRQETITALRSMLEGMQVVMLTTCGHDGKLRSRPMTPVRHEFDGDLWFFALDSAPLVAEIADQCEVNVSYAAPAQHQFVSITGNAQVVRDRRKQELLWKDELQSVFPEGLATPNLVLLQVSANEAEFWDQRLQSGGGLLSAMVSWKGTFQDVHEKIDWHAEKREDQFAEYKDNYSALAESPSAGHPSD